MAGLDKAVEFIWAMSIIAELALLTFLAIRKNFRIFPTFSVYVCLDLSESLVLFIAYLKGYSSLASWRTASLTQGVLLIARSLAIVEVCKHVLSRFRGIWALIWRVLLASAGVAILSSILAPKHRWQFVLPNAERGLDVAMATTIVLLFLFAKYYQVVPDAQVRSLAVGFWLYSCFSILDNTLLQHLMYHYVALWSHLNMLAFLVSLLIWLDAVYNLQTVPNKTTVLLSSAVYSAISPAVNLDLHLLNQNLTQVWNATADKT